MQEMFLFPLLVCPDCKVFIEIDGKAEYDFFVSCVTESIGMRLRAFKDYPDYVPEPIRLTLEEALKCHRIKAWNGCAALSRKAVEIMATDLGGQGRTLFKKLADLKERKVISEKFWLGEDIVRDLGNLAVHHDPDSTRECRYDEANCALAYAYEVSKQIYLRRRLHHFKYDYHKQGYLARLEDINWRKYGFEPVFADSTSWLPMNVRIIE